jgi:hypothetical protein
VTAFIRAPMTKILPGYAAIDAEFTPERLNAMSMEERVSESMVPKIRFCNIDGEGHQGQVVR